MYFIGSGVLGKPAIVEGSEIDRIVVASDFYRFLGTDRYQY